MGGVDWGRNGGGGASVVMMKYVAIRLTRLPDLPLSLACEYANFLFFFFLRLAPAMNQARDVSLHGTLAKPSLTRGRARTRALLDGASGGGCWDARGGGGGGGGCIWEASGGLS